MIWIDRHELDLARRHNRNNRATSIPGPLLKTSDPELTTSIPLWISTRDCARLLTVAPARYLPTATALP